MVLRKYGVRYFITIGFFISLILFFILLTYHNKRAPQKISLNQSGQKSVKTATAVRGNIQEVLQASGTVEPLQTANVISVVGGRIKRWRVTNRQSISAGQIILSIENDSQQEAVMQAETRYSEAKSHYIAVENWAKGPEISAVKNQVELARMGFDEAEQNYKDFMELAEKGFASKNETKEASNTLRKAKIELDASIERLRMTEKKGSKDEVLRARRRLEVEDLALKRALRGLDATIVKAPIEGIFSIQKGEDQRIQPLLVTGNLIQEGQILGFIEDTSRLNIRTNISQSKISRLFIGQQAQISSEIFPDLLLKGKVTYISPQATIGTDGIPNFLVTITLDTFSEKVRSQILCGMSVLVRITVTERKNAVLIPVEAVQGTHPTFFVWTSQNEGIKRRFISIGISNEDNVEVLSGISDGVKVVY